MIKVKNLTFQYDDNREVIRDLSFEIPKGSWVSILGHNGSGKSTLAKLLIGLVEADSGTIEVDGITLNEKTLNEVRKKIGIVFQNPDNQFVGVTVKHDIAFGLENMQVPQPEMLARVHEYAKMVGMEEFLNKEPQQLSGGQKQRVAIAGALAMHKDVIIFDEATSMLDPEGVNEVTKLIRHLNQTTDQTIITITHDLDFALMSDYAIILKDGEKIGEGKPVDLFVNEDLLKSSKLNIPMGLNVYLKISQDESLKNNKELVEALWSFNSIK
ncbi:energy-coupling factor transporter ATPase [Acholeplasma hippikon]|uniref:Cobalt ABC transporter ATPase component n=1 Tax=Acholeplasma hippikon TaxID=264636 RepID=A0A449BKF3_9MOLU|nr:energy-coupling factor transporter ATPase [Acholeplasma hippikon]VEU82946.1 cobalt ABC transporter ATPase component [Acholeplasma hippikon]